MVFIVKLPGRGSRANTPEASNTPTSELPPSSTANLVPTSSTTSVPETANVPSAGAEVPSTTSEKLENAQSDPQQPPPSASPGAELDILLAPSVLHHRYVRGVDKSLIVERPERIRAVLLGIATAIGKVGVDARPPLPSTEPSTTGPVKSQPAADAEDDLVARLGSMSMTQNAGALQDQAEQRQRFRVLHSHQSLTLDPPHPAVAFAHAHAEETVAVLESAYQQAREKRRGGPSPSLLSQSSDYLTRSDANGRETTPMPATATNQQQPSESQPGLENAATAPTTKMVSHAAYLEYLCSRAPDHPPLSRAHGDAFGPTTGSVPEDSEAYTSSDGEGDEAMHPSEIPEHLPQGDLYLAGPSSSTSTTDEPNGGSAEAIRHAMGACCEAVDRVVSATTHASSHSSSLLEIRHDTSVFSELARVDASLVTPSLAPKPSKRAFVLSRPPGHHCSGSTPQGFCWVNNAIVAAAHAYLTHSIDRVVILDIDLHHGNGTQSLAWRINSDANKHDEERAERITSLRHAALERLRTTSTGRGHNFKGAAARHALSADEENRIQQEAGKRALRLFYGSIHDIESFPCEDGDPTLVKDASVCVEGAHGQWIWNIHLDHYSSEKDFAQLYQDKYVALFAKATRFLQATGASPERTLVLISAGFDACSYEYPGMQRHGKSVPPSFYHTFARDTVKFADRWAQGRVISVLEGGYSDRALCSAALAHVTGLAAVEAEGEEEYWKLENLVAVEKVAKKMAAHAATASAAAAQGQSTNNTPKRRQAELPPWLAITSRAFAAFERACGKSFVVPVGMNIPGSAPGAGARGTASASTSTVNSPAAFGSGGRVLRDRSALKPSRSALDSSANTTPIAGRKSAAASSTSTSPSKKKTATSPSKKETSPTKRESPSKRGPQTTFAAQFHAETPKPQVESPSTPLAYASTPSRAVKVESQDQLAMDMDTPIKVPALSQSSLPPSGAAAGGDLPAKAPQTPKTLLPTSSDPPKSNDARFKSPVDNLKPKRAGPQADATTLVDAMSSVQIKNDGPTDITIARGNAFDNAAVDLSPVAVADLSGDDEQDAPGSPDPHASARMDAEYFQPADVETQNDQTDERRTSPGPAIPGGFDVPASSQNPATQSAYSPAAFATTSADRNAANDQHHVQPSLYPNLPQPSSHIPSFQSRYPQQPE